MTWQCTMMEGGYNWTCLIHTSLVSRLRGKRETRPGYEARFVPTAAAIFGFGRSLYGNP